MIDDSLCLVPCEGIFVDVKELTSENVTAENEELLLERYKNYKKFFEPWLFEPDTYFYMKPEPNIKPGLRSIRIFFDTSTFDRIEKDRAAKFEDMLSAIGGTMGLLTGFSIISGVEILYFATKIGWKIIQKNKSSKMK